MIDEKKLIADIKRIYNFDNTEPYGGVPVDIIRVLAMIEEMSEGLIKNTPVNVRIYNIQWDIDGEDVELPTEIVHAFDSTKNLEDIISDWLSDEYGFCHCGFEYIKEENIMTIRYFVYGLGYDANDCVTDYERSFGDFDTIEEARERLEEAVREAEDNLDEFFLEDEPVS